MDVRFGLQVATMKMFNSISEEQGKREIESYLAWLDCTPKEEAILLGLPTEVFTQLGKAKFSNAAFGVFETNFQTYMEKMLTALRNGVIEGLDFDSGNTING